MNRIPFVSSVFFVVNGSEMDLGGTTKDTKSTKGGLVPKPTVGPRCRSQLAVGDSEAARARRSVSSRSTLDTVSLSSGYR